MPDNRCAVPGCGAGINAGKLLCTPCWKLLPLDLQDRLYRTWRRLLDGRGGYQAVLEYRAARADAVAAVVHARDAQQEHSGR